MQIDQNRLVLRKKVQCIRYDEFDGGSDGSEKVEYEGDNGLIIRNGKLFES